MDRDRIRRKAEASFRTEYGWSSRGYLPHYNAQGVLQFVTLRLADSLPQRVNRALQAELDMLKASSADRIAIGYQRAKRIESLLDAGYGACVLREHAVADVIVRSLQIVEQQGHSVMRWVVMPNHIHLLLVLRTGSLLGEVLRSFKGRTGKEANKILGRAGRFWFPEYFDRYIRDSDHRSRVIRYIDQNPVRAGLVRVPEDWPYSSAGYHR